MPTAEIIAIGTELLLGEIQDTNTRFLARTLRDNGVDLYRTTTVGDNAARISQAIREALTRCEIIITTGGLGPTVDDPTRKAVADAMGVGVVFHPELWEQILTRFQHYGRQATENNRRQAYIPEGSIAIENPVGTAPAFYAETPTQSVISLPGVPREMEYLTENAVLPYLRQRFKLEGTIKACVLHTATVGESQIDEIIGDLEILGNPTVGLLAHPGQIDVRVTAKANSIAAADELIQPLVDEIRQRLGDNIYGQDDTTLEKLTAGLLAQSHLKLAVVEAGLGGLFAKQTQPYADLFICANPVDEPLKPELLREQLHTQMSKSSAQAGLGLSLEARRDQQNLTLLLVLPTGELVKERSHGGPPQHSPIWAVTLGLDFLRRQLSTQG